MDYLEETRKLKLLKEEAFKRKDKVEVDRLNRLMDALFFEWVKEINEERETQKAKARAEMLARLDQEQHEKNFDRCKFCGCWNVLKTREMKVCDNCREKRHYCRKKPHN